MWIVAVASAAIGLIAGRSIAAEASAHRRGLPDRWWSPQCDDCDGALTLTMIGCSPLGHRQRLLTVATPFITALIFAGATLSVRTYWDLPAFLVFGAAMVLLTITDLDTKLIPNRILGPLSVTGIALLVGGGLLSGDPWPLMRAAAAGSAYFIGMFTLALLARGGLGFGDVKMAFLIGVFTGYLGWGYVVVAAVGAFLIGGIVAIILLLTRLSNRKDAIAFGPFMTTAAVVAVAFGDNIATWYLR